MLATFGGGCFWCTEAMFNKLKGVSKVVSGYSGGEIDNPNYKQICSGTTGHAEVIQITYNEDKISYQDLLQIHLTTHDPTTLNQQGADMGSQYRSIILAHNQTQFKIALAVIEQAQANYSAPIVTEVVDFNVFYKAEIEHQQYYDNSPNNGYCQVVIAPKIAKFKVQYKKKLI